MRICKPSLPFCLLALPVVVTIAACAASPGDVTADPARFAGERVTLSGRVEEVSQIPLTEARVVRLSAEGGSLPVLTTRQVSVGDRLFLPVEIVGVSSEEAAADARSSSRATVDFLVESGLATREEARSIADSIVSVVTQIAASLEGAYFAVEAE